MSDPLDIIDDRRVARSLGNQSKTAQDCLGLDASGFLLLAEGHLSKAEHTLGQAEEESLTAYMAGEAMVRAILATRHAMKLLNEEEEPCKP